MDKIRNFVKSVTDSLKDNSLEKRIENDVFNILDEKYDDLKTEEQRVKLLSKIFDSNMGYVEEEFITDVINKFFDEKRKELLDKLKHSGVGTNEILRALSDHRAQGARILRRAVNNVFKYENSQNK